jgi:hypothetical protein
MRCSVILGERYQRISRSRHVAVAEAGQASDFRAWTRRRSARRVANCQGEWGAECPHLRHGQEAACLWSHALTDLSLCGDAGGTRWPGAWILGEHPQDEDVEYTGGIRASRARPDWRRSAVLVYDLIRPTCMERQPASLPSLSGWMFAGRRAARREATPRHVPPTL